MSSELLCLSADRRPLRARADHGGSARGRLQRRRRRAPPPARGCVGGGVSGRRPGSDVRVGPRRARAARARVLRAGRRRATARRGAPARAEEHTSASAATCTPSTGTSTGTPAPLLAHLEHWPADALLLSVAVPTIAFTGATSVPAQAWEIVERAAPAYGNDWWYAGLLAFMRQEQGRFDEAMDLACTSLAAEPAGGHAAHARAHAHYETGDHRAGLAWMDDWIDRRRAGRRQARALLLARGPARAVHRRPGGGGPALPGPARGRGRPWAAAPWSTPARCCGAGPSRRGPPTSRPPTRWSPRWSPALLHAPGTGFLGLHSAVALAAADDARRAAAAGAARARLRRPDPS